MGHAFEYRGHTIHETTVKSSGVPLAVIRPTGAASYGRGSSRSVLHRLMGPTATIRAMAWVDERLAAQHPPASDTNNTSTNATDNPGSSHNWEPPASSEPWPDAPWEPAPDPLADYWATEQARQALELLGLRAPITTQQLTAAYHQHARQHHPDAGGDPEKFHRITAAFELLKYRAIKPPLSLAAP
jgi:hypothetical protein